MLDFDHLTVLRLAQPLHTDSPIILTESGKEIAEMIYERHEFLSSWLVKLGVDEKIAAEDACRIEHVISKDSFEAIKNSVK